MDGVREVAGGRVEGRELDGGWQFAGIPFAAAPVGQLRWRPPQPPSPWSGVRPAVEFGPIAPQTPPIPGVAVPGDPVAQDEGCLNLNVWTPALDDGARPVMVWVHGGGFTTGAGSSLLYRGGNLARDGDVVVVTGNYRLGALGFLGHPALGDESTGTIGSWGLLDQIAILRWVREHIAAFGGDPNNVTLFGESAGEGWRSQRSSASRRPAGCSTGRSSRAGRRTRTRSTRRCGPPAIWPACSASATSHGSRSRQVPADELVVATAELRRTGHRDRASCRCRSCRSSTDTSYRVRPEDAVAAGEAASVPLLIGTTRDELTFFALGDRRLHGMDDDGLLHWLQLADPTIPPERIVDAYRTARQARGEPVGPLDLWVAAGSDRVFRWPSLQLAAAQRRYQPATYVYLFTWESPAFGGLLGSCHALEIPFVFGSIRQPVIAAFAGRGPEADALTNEMQRAWLSFAAGRPEPRRHRPVAGMDADRRTTMVFGRTTELVDAPRNDELAAWGSLPLADPVG